MTPNIVDGREGISSKGYSRRLCCKTRARIDDPKIMQNIKKWTTEVVGLKLAADTKPKNSTEYPSQYPK